LTSAALIAVGTVLGAAVNSHHGQIAAQQAQITAQQKQIRSLRQSLVTANAQAASAHTKSFVILTRQPLTRISHPVMSSEGVPHARNFTCSIRKPPTPVVMAR